MTGSDRVVARHFIHYKFARIHKTLRITPAVAASLSSHVWNYEEIAELATEAGNPNVSIIFNQELHLVLALAYLSNPQHSDLTY